jgi:hypothetical protein
MNPLSSQISWKRCADELPDDDNTVLLALIDGEVCTGFRDAGIWRDVTAAKIPVEVTWWAQFPDSPSLTVKEEPSLLEIIAFESNVVCEKVIWLAGNMTQPSNELEEALENGEGLHLLFGLPEDEYADLALNPEEFLRWCARNDFRGLLVEAKTPIPTHFHAPNVGGYSFSWGYCQLQWFYTDALGLAFYQRLERWRDGVVEGERNKKTATGTSE